MNYKHLFLFLTLILINSACAYSVYTFNVDEIPFYNNYFYGNDSNLAVNQEVGGFKFLAITGNGNKYCRLTKDSGFYGYSDDSQIGCELEYDLINNLTAGDYTYQYDWSYRTGTGLYDQYTSITISLYGYNGSYVLLNTSDKASGVGTLTRNFTAYNNNFSKLKFYIYTTHSNILNGWFVNMNWFRLYDRSTIGSSYNLNIVNPSNDSTNYHGLSVPFEYKSNIDLGYNVFYYLINLNTDPFNYTTNSWTMDGLNYNYLDGEGYYHYTGGSSFLYDSNYSNMAIYISSLNTWNNLISKKQSVLRMPSLEDVNIEKVDIDPTITITFKEPDQTSIISGTKINSYSIILDRDYSTIKTFAFTESDYLSTGFKQYTDYRVDRYLVGSDYYINITYEGVYDSDLSTYYYLTARYQQYNGSTTAYSTFTSAELNVLGKFIGLYECNETECFSELLNTYDSVDYEVIQLIPFVYGDDIEWGYQITCLSDPDSAYSFSSVPDDFLSPEYLTLCPGQNSIRIYDMSGTLSTSYITFNYNSTLLNMTLLNYKQDLICFSNDTESDCDFDELTKSFYVKTIHDNYNYTLLNVDIFCEKNESFELFYSDVLTTNNLKWLPYGIYDETNQLIMVFNVDFEQNIDKGLSDYLLSNPELIDLEEYEFTKIVMNSYVKNLNQENKYFYTPSLTNCYVKNTFNDNYLNVSFKGVYSLYNDVKSSTLFFELKSGCYLDRYKNNNVLDYANYYSCLLTGFVSDNSTTFYYLTFLFICLTVRKVLLSLFQ
jgi:hypothetical protein